MPYSRPRRLGVWTCRPPKTVAYDGPTPMRETFPKEETLTYEFAKTAHTTGDIRVKWYDGGPFAGCGFGTAASTQVVAEKRLSVRG